MHGLFFDMQPKPGHLPHYFDHVERLKPILAGHAGLLYLERFRPLDAAEALLSHQIWADETALQAWRREARHRASQAAGRHVHFAGYRIRVGPQVLPGAAAAAGDGRLVIAAYADRPFPAGRGHESLTRPGRFLTLAETGSTAGAGRIAADLAAAGAGEVRVFRIARDYGLTDRSEAPVD